MPELPHGELICDCNGKCDGACLLCICSDPVSNPRLACPAHRMRARVRQHQVASNAIVQTTAPVDNERDEDWNVIGNLQGDRDRWIRLFNRLQGAVQHHQNAKCGDNWDYTDEVDEALYAAMDRVLRDAAKGDA